MLKFDEAGAPAKTFIKQALPDAIDPLEVIESVASTLDDFEESQWLIKRMIECGTLGQIFSGWNVGQSALAVDIACRVATGLDFAGRKVCQGPVLYVAMEGSRGLKRRFTGWQQLNGQSIPGSLYRPRVSTRLPDPESEAKLESALTYIESKHDRGPLLVIIDTLAQTMIGEQNSTSDVDRFVATGDDYTDSGWLHRCLLVTATNLELVSQIGNEFLGRSGQILHVSNGLPAGLGVIGFLRYLIRILRQGVLDGVDSNRAVLAGSTAGISRGVSVVSAPGN